MREGNWKLLCEYDGTQPQLYDLSKDKAETTNLADPMNGMVLKMTKALLEWHLSMPADHGSALGQEQPKKRKAKQ